MKPKSFKRFCLSCEDDRVFTRQTYHYTCNVCHKDHYVGVVPTLGEKHYVL